MTSVFFVVLKVVLLLSGVLWIWCSYSQVELNLKDPTWFSRSGAILICVSAISNLAIRPLLEKNSDGEKLPSNTAFQLAVSTGFLIVIDSWLNRYYVLHIFKAMELLLSIIGTIIWAYGDLLFI